MRFKLVFQRALKFHKEGDRKLKRIFLVCTVLNLSLLIPVMGMAQMKGDAKAGKVKYDANCVGCHGTSGKGDGPAAKALILSPKTILMAIK